MLLSARTINKTERSKQQQQRTRLIEIDKKYSLMMNQQSKKQVTDVLQSELDYLLGKKEIEKMKKRKLQDMQDAFQKERASRIIKMDTKISRSDKNRAQTLREKQTKSKRNLEYIDQKIKKKQHENQQQIQKMLEAQKTYIKKTSQSRSSLQSLNRSQSHLKSSRSFKYNHIQAELEKSLRTIDSKIGEIQSKIDQAKTNQKFYHRQKSQKAKGFSKNFDETMSKIRANETLQQTKCINEYYGRMTHILQCQQKTKTFYQRQSQRRRRNIDDRFKKCNDNLKYLSRERESKLQKLQAKFEKRASPRTWNNQKNGVYLSKFIQNHKQIQQQKLLKADGIVSKHINLSIKNRVLREKKDRIFQTVKKVEI